MTTIDSPRYDWLRRAARTFLQAFVGTLSVMAIPALNDIIRAISSAEPYTFDVDLWQGVIIAACLSGVIALISALQNGLEDKAGMPALGKGVASSGQNPVPQPDVTPPAVPRERWGVEQLRREREDVA